MIRAIRWMLLVVAFGAILWICASSSFLQTCVASQAAASHEQSKESPPKFILALADDALIYCRCFGHTIFEYRDAVTAVATVFIALFTYTLFAATKGLVGAARIQSDDMKRSVAVAVSAASAAKTSADASLLALRPWVSCKVKVGSALTYRDNGDACITIKFTLKNTGKSPAMGVELKSWFTLHPHAMLKQQNVSDWYKDRPITDPCYGLVLFPGDKHVININLPISRAEIEKSAEDIKPRTTFFPKLIGIVSYTFPLTTHIPQTGFIYALEKNVAMGPNGLVFGLEEEITPAENIVLRSLGSFGEYAT